MLLCSSMKASLLSLPGSVTLALILESFLPLLLIHNPLFATETHRFYVSLANKYLAAKPGLNGSEAFYSNYLSHSV